MTVRLLVKQRSEAGGAERGTEVLLEQDAINLGRDSECHVVLAQKAVSRTHARISRDGTLYFIEDLGSAYGTRVNGEELPKGEKRLLRNGDVIAIAQFDIAFDRVVEAPKGGKGPSESNALVARQVVKDVMRGLHTGAELPYFRVMNGPQEGQRYEVQDAQELVIGRDPTADLIFQDDMMSRRHAKIRRDWSGTHVEDLESRNGIRVNRKRVARKTLQDRDELEVGGVRLLYIDPTEVREAVVSQEEPAPGELTEHPKTPTPEPSEPEPEPDDSDAEESEPDPSQSEGGGSEASEAEPSELEESEVEQSEAEEPEDSQLEQDLDEPSVAQSEGLSIANLKSRLADLRQNTALIPLIAMGVFALIALALVIAILAGA